MFFDSSATNATRLLLRCPTCRGHVKVLREDWQQAQTFCSRDGLPLTVVGVTAGCGSLADDWPELFAEPADVALAALPVATVA